MMQVGMRFAVDWNGDFFICYEANRYDALNQMHSGLATDPALVNLHWTGLNQAAISGATVSVTQLWTSYGVRLFHVITGTNTTAGGYFAYDGSGPADILVTNGNPYTAVLWIKGSAGIGTSMKLEMVNAAQSVTFTLSASWQKVILPFTPSSGTTAFTITKNTSATNVTFDASGFMVVAGTVAPNGFNTGSPTDLYDVITADVRYADWRFGKNRWSDSLPAEGMATLTVNNNDRRYTPEYSGSPLYGQMQQKRLLTIDSWKPQTQTWVRMFAGWANNYQPSYGKVADHTAVITAEQGMFRLRETKYRRTVDSTATADAIIESVLLTGYLSAATPLQCLVDYSRVGASYLVDPDAIMALDTGVSTLDLNGEAWGEKDNAQAVIESIMAVEQGWFFIDRSGVIRFYNRHHYFDPALTPAATVIDLDGYAIDGEYVHAEDFKNVVQLTYYPYTINEGQVLWTMRKDIPLLSRQEKEVEVSFEYEEGKRQEAESVNAFGSGPDDSTYTAVNKIGTDTTPLTIIKFTQIDGRSGTLNIRNGARLATQRVTSLVLKGNVRESFGGQIIEVVSEAGTQGGAYILTKSSKLIETEEETRDLAYHLLRMHDRAVGEFPSIMLMSQDDTALARILDNGIGGKIAVSEYQTAHSGEYAIVGENHRWENGILNSKLILEPLARRDFAWVLGVSALGVDTYLAY